MPYTKRKIAAGLLLTVIGSAFLFSGKKVVDVYTQKWEHPFVTSVTFNPIDKSAEPKNEYLGIKTSNPSKILNLTLESIGENPEVKTVFVFDKSVVPKDFSIQISGIDQTILDSLPKIGPLTQMTIKVEILTEQGLVYKRYPILVSIKGSTAYLAKDLLLDVGLVEINTGLQFDLTKSKELENGNFKAKVTNIDNSDKERQDKEKERIAKQSSQDNPTPSPSGSPVQ